MTNYRDGGQISGCQGLKLVEVGMTTGGGAQGEVHNDDSYLFFFLNKRSHIFTTEPTY